VAARTQQAIGENDVARRGEVEAAELNSCPAYVRQLVIAGDKGRMMNDE
jgi:hypothetical protein